MDTFLIKAVQLIIALAFLVIIHEFGHFLFARMFGVRVEKFYIFFDPWVELFKWKPRKYIGGCGKTRKLKGADTERVYADGKKRRPGFWNDTEYGIGWLPLGGYCKISGMIDESMDTEQMKQPAQEWEFRSKPAWQRLLIMIAGVLFNFLLAIVIYSGLVYATGEKYVPFREAKMGMAFSDAAHRAGFRDGDIPLAADGKELNNPADAMMPIAQAKKVTVLRQGKEVDIPIPDKFLFELDNEAKSDTALFSLMAYRFPAKVIRLAPGEGAEKAGIVEGDRILSVDGRPTPDLYTFLRSLRGHKDATVPVVLARNAGNRTDTIVRNVTLNSNSKMGVGMEVNPAEFYKVSEIRYNLLQSVPRGIQMGTDKLTGYAKSMKMVFTKEGAESLGGFGTIGSIFPSSWNWIAFWNITAFLSVALAFMNILPIPALDGGHVLFLLYEVIFRRKPSEKFMERAQITGMVLLIALLIYANGMDIVRLFK